MNDDIRFAAMNLATAVVAGVVAFGVDLSPEASAAAVAIGVAVINLIAKIWKTGAVGDPATTMPIAVSNEAVKQALATPAPGQVLAPVRSQDVEDVIDAYVAKMQAAGFVWSPAAANH